MMMQDKIIIALEVYNFHLFIHYLGEGIEIIKFDNFQSQFHKTNVTDLHYIDKLSKDSYITEISFFNNSLIALDNNKILHQSLLNDLDTRIMFIEKEFDQLSLNHLNNRVDLLTTENTLNSFNLNSPEKLKFVDGYDDIDSSYAVTNMKSSNESVYLSIRGYGVKEINKAHSESFRTEDAQDLEILPKNQLIAIADAFEGVVLYDLKNKKKPLKKIKFEGEIIQEIEMYQKMFLIKGKNGLYLYDYILDKKYQIFEGAVGAFKSYYDMIFFTSQNKIHMISKENNAINTFRLFNDKVEVQLDKIKRK